jgi:hypothetical protein
VRLSYSAALLGALWALQGAAWPIAIARADSVSLPVERKHVSLGGELGYFTSQQDASRIDILTTQLSGHYGLNKRWSLAADWGFVSAISTRDHGGVDATWRPGNPTVYVALRGGWTDTRYRLALGGAAPLAVIERYGGEGRLQHLAYNDAQGMHGLWDAALWAPSRGALIARSELELDVDPEVMLELAFNPTLIIPAREQWDRDSVDVLLPLAVGASTRGSVVRAGLRLQAVMMPMNDPDVLQLSLEPWLRVQIARAFVELRYTGNLDEPLAGERGPRIWAIHVSGGGVL